MAESPVFESPVSGRYSADATSTLTLSDASATTKWLVRAGDSGPVSDHLDVAFGSSAVRASGAALVLGSRPGEWIVVGAVDAVGEVVAGVEAVAASELVSTLDWTHGRALFRVTGSDAAKLLEKVCGLDWSDPMTPDGAVASASVAKVTCDIARNDVGEVASYLVFCDRSFGQYLFDALIDAGNEFDFSVTAAAIAVGG